MSAQVKDVDQADFEEVVLAGSAKRPVVVDFWAEWCGPCRQLSPLLEDMALTYAGEVDVVKVNVDHNPGLAQQFGVQGIPAVKAFVDGRVAGEFTGLQPPAVIDQFFAGLGPSEADQLVVRALGLDDAAERADLLGQAIELEVDHPGAAIALAATQEPEDARATLARARPTPEVQQAVAALDLESGGGDIDALRTAVEGGDDTARVSLGRALAAAGRHEEALAVLLDAVQIPDLKDGARDAVLNVFTTLGNDHPLVKSSRPILASRLF